MRRTLNSIRYNFLAIVIYELSEAILDSEKLNFSVLQTPYLESKSDFCVHNFIFSKKVILLYLSNSLKILDRVLPPN